MGGSGARVNIGKQFVFIDSFAIIGPGMHILADGTISSREDQILALEVENLNLNGLSGLTGIQMDLEGNITGDINYRQEESFHIFSDVSVDTLYFNEQLLGATSLNATWNESRGTINMQLLSEMDETGLWMWMVILP